MTLEQIEQLDLKYLQNNNNIILICQKKISNCK